MNILKSIIILALFSITACKSEAQQNADKSVFSGTSQDVGIVTTFDQLSKYYNLKSDTTYVINFWATWCKPCVAELPFFNNTARELKGKKVQFIFVCLDFISTIEKKVKPFLIKNPLAGKVVILGDQDINTWGSEVDPKWDGAIPVTMLVGNNKKATRLGSFKDDNDLKTFIINNLINN